jgi:ribosomal-protein-alanine N-acetyltransferase
MTKTVLHIPTLETERLRLRAPRAADLPAYTEFRTSERSRFVGGPFSAAQAEQQLWAIAGQWAILGFGRWMVADRATDAPLGIVGIFHPNLWPEPELAWSIFAPAEGRGIAFEAAQAARAHAYDTLGMAPLISCVAPENARSLALVKRMGATPEGTFDHPEYGTMHIWRHPGASSLPEYPNSNAGALP